MKPLDQHRRASLLQPAAPLTEIPRRPTSRDKGTSGDPVHGDERVDPGRKWDRQ